MSDLAGLPFVAPPGVLARRVRLPTGRRPKLAALSDAHGWAFCQQMHDMEQYVGHVFDVTHLYVEDWLHEHRIDDLDAFDSVYCPYHRWDSKALHLDAVTPWKKTLGSLRAQWLFPERRRAPQDDEFQIVNRYAAFNVVTRANFDEYREFCPNLWYLTNPVNMRRFTRPTPPRSLLIASWNGNAGHSNALREDVKGFYSVVRPACARTGTRLVFAEYYTCKKQPAAMPEFYQQANVALCASIYEGASSSVMEAMASGLAVVSTDCGNTREMRDKQLLRYGQTGIRIVERDIAAFERELCTLREDLKLVTEMGEVNRLSVVEDWSWDVWSEGFIEFLLTPLREQP